MNANDFKYNNDLPLYLGYIRKFQDKIARAIQKSGAKTVYESGCGGGFLIKYLHTSLPDVQFVGFDYDTDTIRCAHQNRDTTADYFVGLVNNIPLESNSVDFVLCSQVLEHVTQPHKAMSEMQRVSKRYLLISVPLEPYFRVLDKIAVALKIGLPSGHIHFWSKHEFKELVNPYMYKLHFEYSLTHQLAFGEILK